MNKKRTSSISIENCIHNLTYEGIWKPLPERETEIDFINDFIDSSFKSRNPSILIASGPKSCGKTSVVRTCSLMSEFETQICYLDCQLSDIYNFQFPTDKERRLVILDNFILRDNFGLIPFCYNNNFSVIVIMLQYEAIDDLPDFSDISCIKFSKYNSSQIKNILIEYLQESYAIIDKGIISKISCEVDRNEGTIQDAFQILLDYLQTISNSEDQQ